VEIVQARATAIIRENKELKKEISKFKKDAAVLRSKEVEYRTLFENMPQKIFYKDRDSIYIFCNENYARDLNITPDAIIGATDFDFYPKKLAEKYRADDKRIIKSRKTRDIVEQYMLDGQKVFVHTVKTPVKDENGNVIGVLGIFWDITEHRRVEKKLNRYRKHLEELAGERATEIMRANLQLRREITKRKQAEELQRQSDERYHTLFEHTNDVIIVAGVDGKIRDVNQAAVDLLGYSREEIKAMEAPKLFLTSTDWRRFQQVIEQEGSARDFEVKLRRKDDTDIDGLLTVTVRKSSDEHIVEYLGVLHDMTSRKRAEEAVRWRALIFENVHDGIIVSDLKGNIISSNQAAKLMFGYYKDDFFRKTVEALTTKVIKGTLRNGRWIGEINFTRKDGTDGICEIAVIPLHDEDGNVTSVFKVCRDITERKQSEKSLQQSYDQLRETLIATVNTLASTIEMRDPYTAGHQRRVTILACAIAEEMGLTDEQFDGLRMAGLIHDLGKINVPAEILSKPGHINDIEFSIIRYHPQICHDILKSIELPWPVAKIVLHHHERLDGSGYPQGLKDDEIILEAKILAVADVVEAMASHRPYRPALGIELALEEIKKNRGTLYDPIAVDACIKLFTKKKFRFD
jgi:PAS domain S-box-containing protein